MTTSQWDTVWARARASKHTAIVGSVAIPPTPGDLLVLWVHCNAPWTTGGPIDEVRHRVNKLLGDDWLGAVPAPEPPVVGLRSQLFDERPVRAIDARLVEACNRLAGWSDGHVVLGFDAIDAADAATIATLTQILGHPGWLRLPVILAMHRVPQGPVAELVESIEHTVGNDAVVEMPASTTSDPSPVPFDWTTLPPDVLRVVRAGSVLGSVFEAGLIARLLDEPVGIVLELLQRAADAGATLVDRGEGRFFIPPETVQALQDHMLPSLRDHWHAQLGALLSEPRPLGREASIPTCRELELDARTSEKWVDREVADTEVPMVATAPEERPNTVGSAPSGVYAEMFEPALPVEPASASWTPADAEPVVTSPAPAAMPEPSERAYRTTPEPRADQGRAATHFEAAGQAEAAVEQYLAAVREVASQGDSRRAYAMVQQALTILGDLPPSERRSLFQTQLLIELGREQWLSSVVGPPFTLHHARASLEAARAALPEAPPPELVGQLASTMAGVCYDLGDLNSLQQALNELTVVSRQLLEAGESMLAARLLNDQAAVYVRLGNPVRATHLLSEARGLFDSVLRVSPEETDAIEELAAAEHLLARLALHTPIRPGRESEAYAISIEHALAAESAYERLSRPWDVARVWETLGRLELGQGRPEAARGRLMRALQLQRQMGDVTGLARTTAALANLCIAADQLGEAATLLADSIGLNFEKGSPIGLAFNRRVFNALWIAAQQAESEKAEHLPRLMAEVERRLVQAEAVLGQLTLPGE